MFCFGFFCTIEPIFTSNSVVFVDEGRKNFYCPRAQGILATPQPAQTHTRPENPSPTYSGVGTILGQEGGARRKDRERQSRESKIKFFAEIGMFYIPKTSVLKKKSPPAPLLPAPIPTSRAYADLQFCAGYFSYAILV